MPLVTLDLDQTRITGKGLKVLEGNVTLCHLQVDCCDYLNMGHVVDFWQGRARALGKQSGDWSDDSCRGAKAEWQFWV